MSRDLDPTIEQQTEIGNQIYDALQGDIVGFVRRQCSDNYFEIKARSLREGNSLKVDETLLGDLFSLCQEVKAKLNFEDDIDFYVSSDTSINANTILSEIEGKPHMIEFTSGLYNLMNDEEMKFIIGHEIGHLINEDSIYGDLVHFVFPDEEEIPAFIEKRLSLYDQLAELGSDRYGYEANGNLEACVTAFYKMASGIDLQKRGVSVQSLIAQNEDRLNYFMNENSITHTSHPMTVIRVQALLYYTKDKTKRALTEHMTELIALLSEFGESDYHYNLSRLVASAGLIVSRLNGKVDVSEKNAIIEKLGELTLTPQSLLKRVEKNDPDVIFNDAVNFFLGIDSSWSQRILLYVAEFILADNVIDEKELIFLFDLGHKLNCSDQDIARAIGIQIRENFIPKVGHLN